MSAQTGFASDTAAMIEPNQPTLAPIQELLETTKKVTASLATDPQLLQWGKINFEKVGPLFGQFGLTDNYKKAAEEFRNQVRDILREVEKLDNELRSLAIDIKRNTIKPAATAAQAKRLEHQVAELEKPLAELKDNCALLLDGQKQLRSQLTLPNLIPHAKKLKEISDELIDEGYRFLCFVSDRQNGEEAAPTLARCQAKATKLEQKFKEIELKGMPGLAAAIIEHQIFAGVKAADQIKAYIEDFHQYPPAELEKLSAMEEELEKFRAADLGVILVELPDRVRAVGNNLSALYNKAKSLRNMAAIPAFLKNLDLLYATLTGPLMDELKMKTLEADSPLSPAMLAAQKVPDFFMGLQGLVRTLKLLLHSLSGQKTISSAELQDKTVAILTTCHTYYGTTEIELNKLRLFLEDHLSSYSRPFPYDVLFQFMKGVISTYGSQLEKFVLTYKLPEFAQSDDLALKSEAKGKMTLGRLVNKIEVWTEHFVVY